MKRFVLVIVLGALALLGVSREALAQRFVVVNGQVMGPQELAILDRFACQYVPNGYYWLNTQTGLWGYGGDPTPPGGTSGGGSPQRRRPGPYDGGMRCSPHAPG